MFYISDVQKGQFRKTLYIRIIFMKTSKQNFSNITNINDALVISSLDFIAKFGDLFGNNIQHENLKSIVTSDNRFLGISGKNYNIIQTNEFFDFVNPLLQSGKVSIDNLYIKDSKIVLRLETEKKSKIGLNKGDIISHYMNLTCDFSGKNSNIGIFGSKRLMCLNGMTRDIKDCMFKLRHLSNYEGKLQQGIELMQSQESYIKLLENDLNLMLTTKMNDKAFESMINNILGIDTTNKEVKISGTVKNEFEKIYQIYETKIDLKEYKGLIFGGYSAITDYYSNIKSIRNESIDNNREFNLTFGNSANKISEVYNYSMELINSK